MERLFYVYILKCADNSYYTGVTNDRERRLAEHNAGIDPKSYTYSRRPVVCVYMSEAFTDPMHAFTWEKKLKDWSRKKKEAVINGQWELLPDLSKSRSKK